MAQLLSILALSTKAMTDSRISEVIGLLCFLLTDYGSEKILKKLVGRKDVEDALTRLDMLTKEESLMVVVRSLEVIHHIDGVVHGVDGNVKATKELVEDIDDNVKGIEGVARSVDDNLKVTKSGMQRPLSVFTHMPTLFSRHAPEQ